MPNLHIYHNGQLVQATADEVAGARQALGAAAEEHTHTGLMTQAQADKLAGLPDAAALAGSLAGKASLVGGKLDPAQVPDIALQQYLGAVATEAAMLALVGQAGDWCSRSDTGTDWRIVGDPSTLAGWLQTSYPSAPVSSVNGKSGAVVLTPADIGSVRQEDLGPLALMTLPEAQAAVSGGGALRVVIRGSSGAAGAGSSGYLGPGVGDSDPGAGYPVSATSWAGMLAAEITAAGGVSFNTSRSGTGTQHALDNFVRDIAAYAPSHVVLATSPNNDNFVPAIGTGTDKYIRNMLLLAEKCVSIGAVPILGMGVYPNNLWTENHVRAARHMLTVFERSGYRTVNVLDTVLDRSTGAIVSGLAADGAHLQDPGQAMMFASIPPDLFSQHYDTKPRWDYGDILTLDPADATFAPIRINARRPLKAWTVGVRVHTSPSVATSKIVFAVEDAQGNGSPLRVRTASNVFDVTDTGTPLIASTVPTNVTATRWAVLRHEFATQKTALFVDGVKIGEVATSAFKATDMNIVSIHGRTGSNASNANNMGVSAAFVARRPLTDAEISAVSRGHMPTGRLECVIDDLRGPLWARMQSSGAPAQLAGAYTVTAA